MSNDSFFRRVRHQITTTEENWKQLKGKKSQCYLPDRNKRFSVYEELNSKIRAFYYVEYFSTRRLRIRGVEGRG